MFIGTATGYEEINAMLALLQSIHQMDIQLQFLRAIMYFKIFTPPKLEKVSGGNGYAQIRNGCASSLAFQQILLCVIQASFNLQFEKKS